jgi:tetratricopeptide (TPR) repeat protein
LTNRCPEEAVTHYQQALAGEPDNADIHNNLGIALNTLGEFAQASQAFARAISIAPRKPEFYLNILGLKRLTADDPLLVAMLELYCDAASLDVQSLIALHFALGRAFEDLSEHARSFQHLIMGNALKRRQLIYDEAAALAVRAYAGDLYGRTHVRQTGRRRPLPHSRLRSGNAAPLLSRLPQTDAALARGAASGCHARGAL